MPGVGKRTEPPGDASASPWGFRGVQIRQVDTPTLMQRVLFHGEPGSMAGLLWNVALILLVFLPFMSVFAMLAIWGERRVAGRMQCRPGPNRVGPFGLFQSVADGIKLILKEDLIPANADAVLFRLAPYLAFAPVFAAFMALPFAQDFTDEPRVSSGLFWILAILSVEIMGVILAGWASNNKWSIYGAMREACQMVSYEIPLGISIIVAVMAAGTLNMVELGKIQSGGIHTWLICRNPFVFLAFFVYFIASLASNKRAPFDLPESESELVAGFHTEYSGLRFSMFFFAEYAAMFVVGAIQVATFLGGWNDPFGLIGYYHAKWSKEQFDMGLIALNCIGSAIFVLKACGIVLVQMWLRWTLPRPRIDQVLYTCVKVLLPIACILLLGGAIWPLIVPDTVGMPWATYNPWSVADWQKAGATGALITQGLLAILVIAIKGSLIGWVAYAWFTRKTVRPRLSEAEPIAEVV